MSATLLHHTSAKDFTGTSIASLSVTITSTTAGSTLKVWCQFGSSTTTVLTSITDNKGGGTSTYTIKTRVADTTNNQSTAGAFTANCAAGITSVTMNVSPNTPFLEILVEEWSGESTTPDDGSTGQFQNTPGTTADLITSGNVLTTANGDTINGICNSQTASPATQTLGTGYSLVETLLADGVLTEEKIQTSSGNVAATYTDATNGNVRSYVTIVMAFKVAAGGGGSTGFGPFLAFGRNYMVLN